MTEGVARHVLRLIVLVGLCGGATAGGATAPANIVGTWRGTSTCVNREAAPACNDEQVVYEITAISGEPEKVTVKADKIVDGKRVPIGAMDFTREGEGVWGTEFQTPRLRARWQLAVAGTSMNGTMMLLPSKTVVRRMEFKRDP
jgi:hypothetical protein